MKQIKLPPRGVLAAKSCLRRSVFVFCLGGPGPQRGRAGTHSPRDKKRSALLLQQHLVELREKRRLAARTQLQAQRQRKHTVLLQFFEAVDGGAYHNCKAHAMAGGTPCGKRLRATSSLATTNRRLMLHLRDYHATVYGILTSVLEM